MHYVFTVIGRAIYIEKVCFFLLLKCIEEMKCLREKLRQLINAIN